MGFLPQEANTFANAVVSFVCAMQVQTFRKVRGHAYASTMCIGNMRSGTDRGIWVSCALLAVSFFIMFIREEEKA